MFTNYSCLHSCTMWSKYTICVLLKLYQPLSIHCICLKIPLAKAKVSLEVLNVLLCNLCILHCIKQHFPSGRLEACAFNPFGQASLHCWLHILGIILKTWSYCSCAEPYAFQNCPPLACSYSAHMYPEEPEMPGMICRKHKYHHTFFAVSMICFYV